LSGLGIPFFVIVSFDSFNNKVREVDDVKRITNIPVIGQIPHSLIPKNTAVFVEKESQTAEAFRLLRSKIQSLTQNVTNPVILITSSIPGEGKTFAVTNLSSVISMSGKKTIIVGFDLRKPKINKSIDSDEGVSSWLMGDHDLDNVIKSTNYKNLYVIPSGQVPQNPSELVGSDKTEILIKLLKERFDYIVIDSSPVGTVSDSFHLAELADITILMVRKNVTLKNLLENTAKELIAANSKMLGIVVNDLGSEYKRYRYGGKYGYYNT
jgi:capsular exopolysaccharide synthesis family protein